MPHKIQKIFHMQHTLNIQVNIIVSQKDHAPGQVNHQMHIEDFL